MESIEPFPGRRGCNALMEYSADLCANFFELSFGGGALLSILGFLFPPIFTIYLRCFIYIRISDPNPDVSDYTTHCTECHSIKRLDRR